VGGACCTTPLPPGCRVPGEGSRVLLRVLRGEGPDGVEVRQDELGARHPEGEGMREPRELQGRLALVDTFDGLERGHRRHVRLGLRLGLRGRSLDRDELAADRHVLAAVRTLDDRTVLHESLPFTRGPIAAHNETHRVAGRVSPAHARRR